MFCHLFGFDQKDRCSQVNWCSRSAVCLVLIVVLCPPYFREESGDHPGDHKLLTCKDASPDVQVKIASAFLV